MPKTSKQKHKTQKPGLGLVLDIGPSLKITTFKLVHNRKPLKLQTISLDRWVANFQEALDFPHNNFLLKDYCGADFFVRKAGGMNAQDLYAKTQAGDLEGAEIFVEYGAHMGALIANLETLYKPRSITIKGPLANTFDAWSHSMGKARNEHLGKKPSCKITTPTKPKD